MTICRKCRKLIHLDHELPQGVEIDCFRCFGPREHKSLKTGGPQGGTMLTWDEAQRCSGIYSDRSVAQAIAQKRGDNYERKAGKRPGEVDG